MHHKVLVGGIRRMLERIPPATVERRIRAAERREADDAAIKRAIRRARQWDTYAGLTRKG